jgi:hypothetical protein
MSIVGKTTRWLTLLCLTLAFLSGCAPSEGAHWVATWGASPFGFMAFGPAPAPEPFVNQTVRQKLRISVGGEQVRIRFSNELGTTPLIIGAATLAVAGRDSAIDRASLRELTFGGASSVTIPAGAPVLSDPVDLVVQDLAELAVSIYLPEEATPATMHMGRSAYVTAAGDFTKATELQAAELTTNHVFLTSVYVRTNERVAVVAAFGDSITDGAASTPHSYNSWPDHLATRVAADNVAVVNHGISGNQLLRDGAGVSALARFDRDVLSTPGLTHVVVLEGINDIGTGRQPNVQSTQAARMSRSRVWHWFRSIETQARGRSKCVDFPLHACRCWTVAPHSFLPSRARQAEKPP